MVERALDTTSRERDSALITFTWEAAVAASDTFEALDMKDKGGISDAILSVSGNFAADADFGAEHSVDNVTYTDCVDAGGTAIALTAAGNIEVRGFGRYIRPKLNGGTPTSVIPIMQFRRVTR